MIEGREAELLSLAELCLVELIPISGHGCLQDGAISVVCLDDGMPLTVAPTDPTQHLAQKLIRALLRRKVREIQTTVCQHYAQSAEVGQIQSLSEQLCTNQDVDLTILDGLVVLLKALRLLVVGIKTLDARLWKQVL